MRVDFQQDLKRLRPKLLKLKVLLFDVDGIMTDGLVQYQGGEVTYNRSFNTMDALGLKMMKQIGLKTGIITGGSSIVVDKWFKDYAQVDFLYKGNEDKRAAYQEILMSGLKDEEILYMGDDFIDYPLLKRAGVSASVSHAPQEILEMVDYVAQRPPGFGAAREVMELVRSALGLTPAIPLFEGQTMERL